MGPGVVFEFEDGDVAVGGGAGEKAAGFVRCPGDEVYGGGVEGDFVDFLPRRGLFAPDYDFAVVRGRGEDVAVFRMCLSIANQYPAVSVYKCRRTHPCYTPDSALVSVAGISDADAPGLAQTYPFSVSTSLCDSPSTSKILIVLSDEHVANRLP